MISASAPSLSQYIPNFQEKFTKCSQIIDSLIAVFQGVPMIIKNSLPQIDETNAQNHQIGALIHLTELVKIDIIKFTNETPVSTQQSLLQNFRTNGLSIYLIYQYLFALLGGSSGGIPAAMQKVSTVNPSLLDLFQLSQKLLTKECDFFIQFLAQLEYADAASILSQSFVTKKNTQIPSIASMKNVDKVAFVAQKKSQYTVRCPQTRSPSSQPSARSTNQMRSRRRTRAYSFSSFSQQLVVCGQNGIDLLHTIIAQCFSITNQSCQALQAGRGRRSDETSAQTNRFLML